MSTATQLADSQLADSQGDNESPYETPCQLLDEPPSAPTLQERKSELIPSAVSIAGVFLMLFGSFGSIFAVIDLYMPSAPLLCELLGPGAPWSPWMLWCAYAALVSAAAAGSLMFGSREIPPSLCGVIIICPLLFVVCLLSIPLRTARQWAMPISAIYLAIGTCSAAFAVPHMISFYSIRDTDEALRVMGFHVLLVTGITLIAGAVVKLVKISGGEIMPEQSRME